MSILPILSVPDPRLKIKSAPVKVVDDRIRQLIEDMLETMVHANGIGLAAPQINVHQRVVVMDVSYRMPEHLAPFRMVNPEITWVSDHDAGYTEGCLSVPEHYADVIRPTEVKVKYLNEQGISQEIHATGLLAVCIQHEIDHLDGVLFLDHLSQLKRNMILRKVLKSQKHKTTGTTEPEVF